jgi:Holliday junction DNA helicase RuvA
LLTHKINKLNDCTITGKLIEKNATNLIIDCNGVGYEVKISLNTYSTIGSEEFTKVYTQFIVREDAQLLYGFATKEEREMFNLLISVSGIGPNTAMIMLSSLMPAEIAHAIQVEDVRTIQSIKGIGAKTAQRVIIDLKDKVLKFSFTEEILPVGHNTNKFDALTALVSLGFDKKNSEKALDKIIQSGNETVEELIKGGLKIL